MDDFDLWEAPKAKPSKTRRERPSRSRKERRPSGLVAVRDCYLVAFGSLACLPLAGVTVAVLGNVDWPRDLMLGLLVLFYWAFGLLCFLGFLYIPALRGRPWGWYL